jgi:hypothetical protein
LAKINYSYINSQVISIKTTLDSRQQAYGQVDTFGLTVPLVLVKGWQYMVNFDIFNCVENQPQLHQFPSNLDKSRISFELRPWWSSIYLWIGGAIGVG